MTTVIVSVVGCGYLGAVHAAGLASVGHQVVGVDVDADRIAALAQGKAPFFEPGLDELLEAGLASGRLTFSEHPSAVADAQVHFLAVGTPQRQGGASADTSFVDSAVDALMPYIAPGSLIAGKSTVPVGTAERIALRLTEAGIDVMVAWNPEFLREGFAIEDTLRPDRLVYGVEAGPRGAQAAELLDDVYRTVLDAGTPRIVANLATAELVKASANAFLATKISFINAISEVAEVVGADVTAIADAIGYDSRIGRRFLNAGVGFGGGCLPKDIRAFRARGMELGVGSSLAFLDEIDAINLRQRDRVVRAIEDAVGGDPEGKRVAVLGLAFKPDSDDIRDSPALDIALRLQSQGASVVATDPHAMANARRADPDLELVATAEEAVRGADVVVLVTEWEVFRSLDPEAIVGLPRTPHIIDARNVLVPQKWRDAGWIYRSLGRP